MQEILEDKKAMDLVVLDVRERSTVTDWIVVASGMSKPHIKALYEDMLVRLKHEGVPCYRHNGEVEGGWLVLDYFNVVLHLFVQEVRDFYQIEDLWKESVPGAPVHPVLLKATASGAMDAASEEVYPRSRKISGDKPAAKRKATKRPSAKKQFEGVAKRVKKAPAAKKKAPAAKKKAPAAKRSPRRSKPE